MLDWETDQYIAANPTLKGTRKASWHCARGGYKFGECACLKDAGDIIKPVTIGAVGLDCKVDFLCYEDT